MKINNKEIETFGLTLLNYDIGSIEIENRDEWTDGRLTPYLDNQFFKYRTVVLEFLLEQNTDDLAEQMISKLIQEFKISLIEFDNMSIERKGVLENLDNEIIVPGKHDLIITIKSEYGITEQVTQTITGTSGTINLNSSAPTPVVLKVTPTTAGDLMIKGFDSDILLEGLTAGKTYVVDGERGLVTVDDTNVYNIYKSWTFPKIEPGINSIIVSETGVDLKVEYSPRWF